MKWISEVNTLNNKESRLGGGPSLYHINHVN